MPAFDLRTVTEIEVFGQRVVFPAAGAFDTSAPPDAAGAVEVEEPARAGARGLFDEEMSVEKHRLHARQQRVLLVEMTPSRLDHADAGVGEVMNRFVKQVRLRDK